MEGAKRRLRIGASGAHRRPRRGPPIAGREARGHVCLAPKRCEIALRRSVAIRSDLATIYVFTVLRAPLGGGNYTPGPNSGPKSGPQTADQTPCPTLRFKLRTKLRAKTAAAAAAAAAARLSGRACRLAAGARRRARGPRRRSCPPTHRTRASPAAPRRARLRATWSARCFSYCRATCGVRGASGAGGGGVAACRRARGGEGGNVRARARLSARVL